MSTVEKEGESSIIHRDAARRQRKSSIFSFNPRESVFPGGERRKRINQSNIGTNTKVITQLEIWSQMRTLEKYNRMSSENYNYINQIKGNIILQGTGKKNEYQ